MFGFEVDENFIIPYISKSVGNFGAVAYLLGSFSEISVYIPLGGSRCKSQLAIIVTFLLCSS